MAPTKQPTVLAEAPDTSAAGPSRSAFSRAARVYSSRTAHRLVRSDASGGSAGLIAHGRGYYTISHLTAESPGPAEAENPGRCVCVCIVVPQPVVAAG